MNGNPTTIRKIVTVGAYGFDVDTFFDALQQQQVDTFADIRQRRGVRGAQYAFANSLRLQAALAERGIRYVYIKDLAPTTAVRDLQRQADITARTAKRARSALGPTFVAAYEAEILAAYSVADFMAALPADTQVVALFCVEREPAACHRSLVAQQLRAALSVPIMHLVPPLSSIDT